MDGAFEAIWPKRLRTGEYTLRVRVTDTLGAQSEWSDGVTVTVSSQAAFQIGRIIITYFQIILILLGLLLLLCYLLWLEKRHYHGENKELMKEIKELEKALHDTFNTLRKNARHHLKLLEQAKIKRDLTKEEEVILRRLEEDMDFAEKAISKDVKDVRKAAEKIKMPVAKKRAKKKSATKKSTK